MELNEYMYAVDWFADVWDTMSEDTQQPAAEDSPQQQPATELEQHFSEEAPVTAEEPATESEQQFSEEAPVAAEEPATESEQQLSQQAEEEEEPEEEEES